MKPVKRFDIVPFRNEDFEEIPNPEGTYVKYSDYKLLRDEYDRVKNELSWSVPGPQTEGF